MDPLLDSWKWFYADHETCLQKNYPGLNKRRFLQDIQDILRFQSGISTLNLGGSIYSVSEALKKSVQEDLLSGVPLAVQIGEVDFMGHKYFVNKNVLVPRPETEFLVDLVTQELKGKVNNVLDVGCGSGVILLSLLIHGVGERGMGVDISPEALKVAKINAHRHRLNPDLHISDRLSDVKGTFELIISNPPYIKLEAHRNSVHPGTAHEPSEALYLPDAEYETWFEDFFLQVKDHLKGTFFMEGHEFELESQGRQLSRLGFSNVRVMNDLTGRPRFLKGTI